MPGVTNGEDESRLKSLSGQLADLAAEFWAIKPKELGDAGGSPDAKRDELQRLCEEVLDVSDRVSAFSARVVPRDRLPKARP